MQIHTSLTTIYTILRNEMNQSHNYDAEKQTTYSYVHEEKQ